MIAGGVDPAFTPHADAERARAALGPHPRPYVLCVASQTARKNLKALVPAARRSRDGIEVVVAGGHRPQFAREAGLEALRHLGAVPDALLPGLYAGAEAFALPSLYEGFGLPVLEAMACGTPVIAADATALPETAGGAARLAAPRRRGGVCELLGARRSGRGCAPPASRAPRASPGTAPRARWTRCSASESPRRAPEHGQRAGGDQPVAAHAPQPRPVERVLRRPRARATCTRSPAGS